MILVEIIFAGRGDLGIPVSIDYYKILDFDSVTRTFRLKYKDYFG